MSRLLRRKATVCLVIVSFMLLVPLFPVWAITDPPAASVVGGHPAVGDSRSCSQPYDVAMQSYPQDLCPYTYIWVSAGKYWIAATWDVEVDGTSTDAYGVFIGQVYVGGSPAPQEAVLGLNVAKAASMGPRPRYAISRSWVQEILGTNVRIQLVGRKTGGNGSTKTYFGHTSLQMVQVQ